MAVLKRKANGTWSTRIEAPIGADGRRQQVRLHATTRAELARQVAHTVAQFEERGAPPRERTNMSQLFDRWLEKKALEVDFRTIEGYRDQVRLYLKPWFGHSLVTQIRTKDVQNAIDSWQRSSRFDSKPGLRSARTINYPLTVLSSAFKYGKALGLCNDNPVTYVQRPKKARRKPAAVDAFEAIEILKIMRVTDLFAPIWTAFAQGLRRGELVALRRRDANLLKQRLHIEQAIACRGSVMVFKAPKRAKSERELPLSVISVRVLALYMDSQERRLSAMGLACGPDTPLFDSGCGEYWNPDAFGAAYTRELRRANHSHLRLHGTRHTFASIALDEGVQLSVISDVLGHESMAFTADFYAHVFPSALRSAVDRVSDALGALFTDHGFNAMLDDTLNKDTACAHTL